jgi:ribonuclease Z
VKKLILTHISQRYEDASKVLKQAKRLFRNTAIAEDFMKLDIPLLEE